MNMHKQPNYWAVIPAAGVGQRMESLVPKQYLKLGDRLVIEHVLQRFIDHPRIKGAVVAIGAGDAWWRTLAYARHPAVTTVTGGKERCHSVLNALRHLSERASDSDWVLVHDAARPCLRADDIDRLIDQLQNDPVGGLLGMPVRDTMKRCDASGQVKETVERQGLWHAYTPQMFRLGALRQALADAIEQGKEVTDEASAMELAGQPPMLVGGRPDNIKITRPEDLPLAAFYLSQQD